MHIFVDTEGYLKYEPTGYDPVWNMKAALKKCPVAFAPLLAGYNCPPKDLTCAITATPYGRDASQDPRAWDARAANLRWVARHGRLPAKLRGR